MGTMGKTWPGRDADHSPSSSAEVKNEFRAIYPLPFVVCMAVAGQLHFTVVRWTNCSNPLPHAEVTILKKHYGWQDRD
jgi:hypothetical protein